MIPAMSSSALAYEGFVCLSMCMWPHAVVFKWAHGVSTPYPEKFDRDIFVIVMTVFLVWWA